MQLSKLRKELGEIIRVNYLVRNYKKVCIESVGLRER